MFKDNIRRLAAPAFTLISFGAHGACLDHTPQISEVYRLPLETSAPNSMSHVSAMPTIPQSFISNPLSTYTVWHLITQPLPVRNEVSVALNQCGVDEAIGNDLLNMAKGILAEMNHANVKVAPVLVTDPEENATYLTLRLYVHATFEESLQLDSKLTSELIQRVGILPESLSFSVYDIG